MSLTRSILATLIRTGAFALAVAGCVEILSAALVRLLGVPGYALVLVNSMAGVSKVIIGLLIFTMGSRIANVLGKSIPPE